MQPPVVKLTRSYGFRLTCGFGILTTALIISLNAADSTLPRGSEKDARKYYGELSKKLKFSAQPDVTTLDELLQFLGYPMPAKVLESTDPAVLMDPARVSSSTGSTFNADAIGGAKLRDGDVLAARFFAPKIVNVNTDTPVPGWRKLVRLKVRPDSQGARRGVEACIILFNFIAPPDVDPFATGSLNTQAMLLVPTLPERLLWLDFNPAGTLGLALNASFDAADLTGPNHNYFVPDGCNGCHGSPDGSVPPMVNYLDTDNWFDRLDDPDFASLKAKGTPILSDARTNDSSDSAFHQAFDVIRRFNEEALRQNTSVHPDLFETEAARTWLRLHASSDERRSPVDRGFSLNGKPKWSPGETEGLARLNRYCFRCHGSVRFSVFDRSAVVGRGGNMRDRLKPDAGQQKSFKMPPDRVLPEAEIQALDEFLKKLK